MRRTPGGMVPGADAERSPRRGRKRRRGGSSASRSPACRRPPVVEAVHAPGRQRHRKVQDLRPLGPIFGRRGHQYVPGRRAAGEGLDGADAVTALHAPCAAVRRQPVVSAPADQHRLRLRHLLEQRPAQSARLIVGRRRDQMLVHRQRQGRRRTAMRHAAQENAHLLVGGAAAAEIRRDQRREHPRLAERSIRVGDERVRLSRCALASATRTTASRSIGEVGISNLLGILRRRSRRPGPMLSTSVSEVESVLPHPAKSNYGHDPGLCSMPLHRHRRRGRGAAMDTARLARALSGGAPLRRDPRQRAAHVDRIALSPVGGDGAGARDRRAAGAVVAGVTTG